MPKSEPVATTSLAKRPRRVLPWIGLWAKRLATAVLALVAATVVAVALLIRHYGADLPSTADLKAYNPPQVTRILARDGTVLGELFVERRTLVGIGEIPTQMKLAALAAEDASFYEHAGLNYLGMLRALAKNVGGSARQGGSTITQQVVKNVLLSPERTMDRKMREVILARRIEAELTKDEILDLYLNQIYFGHGRFGVEEAARYYFGKGIRDVTLGEAALIAGIIKGPAVYSPRVDLARAKGRREFVLQQMALKGFARADQVAAALREAVVIAPEPESRPELAPEVVDEVKRALRTLVGPMVERGGYTVTTTIDPALEAAARAAVRHNADEYAKRHKAVAPLTRSKKEPAPFEGTPSGHHAFLGVVTGADDAANTLNVRVGTVTGTVDLATAARYNPKGLRASQFADLNKVVRVTLLSHPAAQKVDGTLPSDREGDHLAKGRLAKKAHLAATATATALEPPPPDPAAAPTPLKLHLELGPESALVALDVRTREVLALVGSYEAVRSGLDRSSSHRQPGSTFKPFVYSYALHSRSMTAASIVETNPGALHGYRPDNYDEGEGKTPKRLRDALAESVNVAAVWTLERVGAANVASWAHALGIESKLGADLSLALGSYEVTPREMAAAYAAFAAGGTYQAPILIQKVVGPNGLQFPLPEREVPRRVLEESEAYLITSLMTSVVRDGTAKRAKSLGRPIAGKTGTSNQSKDAWFVGYSTDIACAVWTGFDEPAPLGASEAGATAALPVFVDFMREAHKKRPVADFPVPVGVARVMIDPATGLRAYPDQKDALEEFFLVGTEPADVAVPDAGLPDAASEVDAGAPSSGLTIPREAPPPF